jgi:hypothetical protein
MLIGYMRVSTGEQSLDLQRDALDRAGCEWVFGDVCSGRATERPGLGNALDIARDGDTLVVWKLDRIGRSLPHVVGLVGDLQKRGVGLKVSRDICGTALRASAFSVDFPIGNGAVICSACLNAVERPLALMRSAKKVADQSDALLGRLRIVALACLSPYDRGPGPPSQRRSEPVKGLVRSGS